MTFMKDSRFLTQEQDAETRKDQYAQKNPFNGSGDAWGASQLSATNEVQYVGSQDTKCCVEVISVDGSIIDSNGFYKVKLLDMLTGFPTVLPYDYTTEMRLDALGDCLVEGQTAVAIFNSATSGSPLSADDGFMLLLLAVKGMPFCDTSPGETKYVYVVDGFVAGTGGDCHSFTGKFCNCQGSIYDENFRPCLLENLPYRYPNLINGNVVPVTWNSDLEAWLCPIQDDFVGAIKLIDCTLDIPQGWTVVEEITGKFVLGSNNNTCNSTGGSNNATVYPGNNYSVSANNNCASVLLGNIGATSVMSCGASMTLPPYTVDTVPSFIRYRYIIRVDNSIPLA